MMVYMTTGTQTAGLAKVLWLQLKAEIMFYVNGLESFFQSDQVSAYEKLGKAVSQKLTEYLTETYRISR